MAALKPSEVNEVNQFLTEPAVSEEAQQALDQAEKTLADARHKLNALSTSELEHARSTDTPSADLKRTVEAVCGMFELRADFCLAQSRLMRSAEGLRRRLVNFDPSQVPRNAPARLQLFVGGPAPSTEKEPVAAALHSWVVAMLAHDAAAMEAQMCVEEVECSPTMVAACEAVCDLYGLTNVDDDLRGALMLAAAFPDKSEATKETEAAGHSEAATSAHDAAETAQFDALQQKVYRLRQFTSLLKKDIDAAVAAVCTQHESLQTQVERLGDRHGWMTILSTSAGNGDEVLTLAITLMLGLVFPDALAKTTDGRTDVMTAASSTVAPVNRSAFDKFMNALRNIQLEITEARCELQDVATLQSLAEQLEQRYPGHRFQVGGSTPTYLCDWLIGLTKYHTSMLQLATKKTQLAEMQEELAEAVKAMKAAQHASGAACGGGYDAVSATQVKAVQEEAAKQGANAPAEWARWALKRTGGNEATSAALLIAQPAARRVLLALRNPSDHLLRTEAELSTVSPQMVRRVRLSFRKDKVRQVVDECVKVTNHFPSNEADGEAIGDMNASMVELLLFRWALGVCDYVEGLARTQPQQQKVMLLERKLEEKTRALTVSLTNQRREAEVHAHRLEVPIDLFPALTPWHNFPWEQHCLPRSEAEEQLRAAIGLRDLAMLKERLLKAAAVGLSRRKSRIFFEAVELRDLLLAQQAMDETATAAAAAAAAAQKVDSKKRSDLNLSVFSESHGEDEPRSPLRGKAASAGNIMTPPPVVREKTQDAVERLSRALDVFVEPVCTNVPNGLPNPKPFVEVLRREAERFDHFVRRSDTMRRDEILATVSSAVGVTDIETEQCREQEQEKAQEQEQEQEIEMERYVDMAYQRDDEEPRRWAFCTLGEKTDDDVRQQPSSLAPFASGCFYPAAQFRLHGRAPLPFPQSLHVSRNHFNLEWIGERRLKNAVCVLEYIPSVGQLQRVAPPTAELSEEQSLRLRDALALLDLRGDGQFSRTEVSEVVRAAELEEPEEAAIDQLLGSRQTLSTEEMRQVLLSGALRRGDLGRHFVLLSLAEAETIRCILHMRQGKQAIPGSDVALALRCIPAGDAVFDKTAEFPVATTYHRRLAHQSFRFLDSAMHYRPCELNVLLRSLPAPPAARRLFFSMVVACRRRLAKRWEQTPLAKLFSLEDEWAMLKLEALRVRIRAAIKQRGLLLHDAFLLFDHDDDGALSLVEVLGAFSWLGLLNISAVDVVTFVRSLSRSAQLSYGTFMELLSDEESEVVEIDGQAATETPIDAIVDSSAMIGTNVAVTAQTEHLASLWMSRVASERALDEQLEAEMAAQAERTRKLVEQQLVDSNFTWMRSTRNSGARNPHTTRTSCLYDFTVGTLGSQKGAPLWMEGRGRWYHVLQGSARVPCLRGCNSAFLVLRVPYRKSGGGTFVNTWTLSMMIKLPNVSSRPLLSTGGWDQYTKMQEGDDHAQLVLSDSGVLGTVSTFASEGGAEGAEGAAALKPNTWHAISMTVDAVSGVVRTYVDGEDGVTVRSSKVCKDGQFALKGRLALFFGGNRSYEYYCRSATVHNRVLDAAQVAKEHTMLHELLMEDAIAAVPLSLRSTVASENAGEHKFASPATLKARVRELRASGTARATELWRALLLEKPTGSDEADAAARLPVDSILSSLQPHDLAVGVKGFFERKANTPIEETDAPFGETLLHAAACAGRVELVDALLGAGAKPSKVGHSSGCTPLHAAAIGGHSAVCERLLEAGAKVGTLSSATKRSALLMACLKCHAETARVLVTIGGADPYECGGGGESAMALLRRLGTPESLTLLSELDVLCATGGGAECAAQALTSVDEGGDCVEAEESDVEDECDSDDDDGAGSGDEEDDDLIEEDEDEEE